MKDVNKLYKEYSNLDRRIDKMLSDWRNLLKQIPKATTVYQLEKEYPDIYNLVQNIISNIKKMSIRAKEKWKEYSKMNKIELGELIIKLKSIE
jgi:hypothetical protein